MPTTTRLRIELPYPPDILRPNRIGGAPAAAVTRARRKARKEACEVAASVWRADDPYADLPGWTRVRAHLTVVGLRGRMDGTNAEAWTKAIVDGVADALMRNGDDHGWSWDGETSFERSGQPGIVIEVWEA